MVKKRYLIFTVFGVLLLAIGVISVNAQQNAYPPKDVVENSDITISASFLEDEQVVHWETHNRSTVTMEYGAPFFLERYNALSGWQGVPVVNENVAWILPLYTLKPGETTVADTPLENLELMYGPLSPGRYRLVREFNPSGFREDVFYAAGEFTLN